ncbi:SufD family Fe-S cluster assembly protein, partial [Candidatus Roizmanbacteria bacterium]|nr:SufD family Fe-S cluster assembly protein [Candidatus Roizmanbacteria bacterium]
WEDLPREIRNTYDQIGLPEAEKKFLAGISAQYESEVVYKSIISSLTKKGVIFVDPDTAFKKYPEIFKPYFGTIIPPADNKFAALNSTVFSGGSFIYVPKGVHVDLPLQAYFRINARQMGQFERTLIIADEGSFVHYLEGCTAPIYSVDSLHSAVVEIIVKKGARVRYTTIQNWSNNVYNLVTKRAAVYEEGIMEWVDCNLGCLSANTKVFTKTNGYKYINEVKPGEKIYCLDFTTMLPVAKTVKAVANKGTKQTFKITTENYREIIASSNHPFLSLEKSHTNTSLSLVWKRLEDLKLGDLIGIIQGIPDEGRSLKINFLTKAKNLKNRITVPLQTDERLMWLLGLYLGDGYLEKTPHGPNRTYFAVPKNDRAYQTLIKTIKKVLGVSYKHKGICVTINSKEFAQLLIYLGFSGSAHTKRIPQWVFILPQKEKLALIKGYFDADGHLRNRRNKNGELLGQITFASCNKELLEDMKLLMIGCGLNPLKISTYVKKRVLFKNKIKTYTTHYLTLNIKENWHIISKQRPVSSKIKFSKILSIEPQSREEVYDLEIAGVHNFIANGIIVHNSKLTMKYPSVYLLGKGSRGDILSLAYAGKGQHQDAGGKAIHVAPDTSSTIISKSISKDGGQTSYRGLLEIAPGAKNARSNVRCDALIMDEKSRSDTYPTMKVSQDQVNIGHEAIVSKVGEEQLFYLQSRGLTENEAQGLIINGFIEPIVKELPMEYAVEMNRLIQLQMSGSVG